MSDDAEGSAGRIRSDPRDWPCETTGLATNDMNTNAISPP
ncbi:MAG: hypothetical protein OJF47_002146 [Nitrospira sp.]|nr:MAG: hypothetical protein OJF47_002146 [Nitrospira sp.]